MRGTVSFIPEWYRHFICFDYPWLSSHGSIISVAAIESMRYFFHVLMVKGEVFRRQFLYFYCDKSGNFLFFIFICEYCLIKLRFLSENKLLITRQVRINWPVHSSAESSLFINSKICSLNIWHSILTSFAVELVDDGCLGWLGDWIKSFAVREEPSLILFQNRILIL